MTITLVKSVKKRYLVNYREAILEKPPFWFLQALVKCAAGEIP